SKTNGTRPVHEGFKRICGPFSSCLDSTMAYDACRVCMGIAPTPKRASAYLLPALDCVKRAVCVQWIVSILSADFMTMFRRQKWLICWFLVLIVFVRDSTASPSYQFDVW